MKRRRDGPRASLARGLQALSEAAARARGRGGPSRDELAGADHAARRAGVVAGKAAEILRQRDARAGGAARVRRARDGAVQGADLRADRRLRTLERRGYCRHRADGGPEAERLGNGDALLGRVLRLEPRGVGRVEPHVQPVADGVAVVAALRLLPAPVLAVGALAGRRERALAHAALLVVPLRRGLAHALAVEHRQPAVLRRRALEAAGDVVVDARERRREQHLGRRLVLVLALQRLRRRAQPPELVDGEAPGAREHRRAGRGGHADRGVLDVKLLADDDVHARAWGERVRGPRERGHADGTVLGLCGEGVAGDYVVGLEHPLHAEALGCARGARADAHFNAARVVADQRQRRRRRGGLAALRERRSGEQQRGRGREQQRRGGGAARRHGCGTCVWVPARRGGVTFCLARREMARARKACRCLCYVSTLQEA
ncbi:MAG: hypothetical protein J3K34DRAFT_436123 [Monoraphidium minutum]|nr:MAG: hypothetical protein J3K34DRAFT_436123 [Monoraphidium minutum]